MIVESHRVWNEYWMLEFEVNSVLVIGRLHHYEFVGGPQEAISSVCRGGVRCPPLRHTGPSRARSTFLPGV